MQVQEFDIISFYHHYYKLNNESYTTLRGKSWKNRVSPGQIVQVNIRNKFHHFAKVEVVSLKRFKELNLDFLKQDGEYPGFQIRSKSDFIQLINSFRRFNKIKIQDASSQIFSIIYLKKVKKPFAIAHTQANLSFALA